MRDTDKTPAQCATVQGEDSPCAARERARIRAEVKDLLDRPSTLFGKWVKMDNVLWIIDGKDASHE
jgi:hypothetical protein